MSVCRVVVLVLHALFAFVTTFFSGLGLPAAFASPRYTSASSRSPYLVLVLIPTLIILGPVIHRLRLRLIRLHRLV